MTDTEKFQAWADRGHWTNWERRPAQTLDLCHLVEMECMGLGEHEKLGTTQLVDRILPGLDDIGRAYITTGLNYLRKHGELSDCYVRGGKNPRTFGHRSILWVSPIHNGTIGLEDIL